MDEDLKTIESVIHNLSEKYPELENTFMEMYGLALAGLIYKSPGETEKGFVEPTVNFHHSLKNIRDKFPEGSKEYLILCCE